MRKLTVVAFAATMVAGASADIVDRPTGIKIGQHMTLRPYVSLSVGYDSNVRAYSSNSKDSSDVLWTVNPGLNLDYKAENWSLLFNIYYNYHAYTKHEYSNTQNQHTYGESLRWNWANSKGAEKGWSLMLSESFQKVAMSDDLSYYDGSGYTADRSQLNVAGALQRRFNEHWHGDLNASYYMLDYENDTSPDRYALYGWQRWTVGAEAGFAPSPWTDFIAAVGYQGYDQDNVQGSTLDRNSQGYTVQGGIGSFATERISYRALVGWSWFDYAGGDYKYDGFVYTLSANWKISDTFKTMLLATSYFQPSERSYASKTRIDSVSWGIAKALVSGRLRSTFDLSYRHEEHECVLAGGGRDYDLDVVSARLGFNYTLNRFLVGFLYGEYIRSWNSESDSMSSYCDYDRWRITTGVRLTY